MSDLGTLTLYMAGSAGINAVSKVSKQEDPTPGLIASGMLFGIFAIVGAMWRYDVVKAIAGLMLLSAILVQGAQFFKTLSKLAGSIQTGTRTAIPVPKQTSATTGGAGGAGASGSGGGGGSGGGI